LRISLRAFLRQTQWIQGAAVAYPERWARASHLAACLVGYDEIDSGLHERQVQICALCMNADGTFILYSHHLLLGNLRHPAEHAGCAIVGLSIRVIEAWCRSHPNQIPDELSRFSSQSGLFAGPTFNCTGTYEWTALYDCPHLVDEVDRVIQTASS
jgi:hypothetical protein